MEKIMFLQLFIILFLRYVCSFSLFFFFEVCLQLFVFFFFEVCLQLFIILFLRFLSIL